ncbi:MAG: SRPBCC domain-containing protein [Novosphingobium sp.]
MSKSAKEGRAATGGVRLEHRIEIAARAEAVWAILQDIDGWGAWNPVYIRAEGTAALGQAIRLIIKLPGMGPQRGRGTIVAADPPTSLHFHSDVFGGLVRATRTFDIAPASATTCTVLGGEVFAGLLGPVLARSMGKRVQAAIEAVNLALKRTAEA